MSLAGPVGRFLGAPFQIPDLLYDVYDLYKNPSASNALSVVLDYPVSLSRYTNTPIIGKFDDWLPPAGIIDDTSVVTTGKSIGDWIENAVGAGKIKRSLENAGKRAQEQWNGQYFPYYP